MLETDFENEANNAMDMRRLVHNEPRLRDRVYIPTVYPELSSKRVMTAEWIEGVRLWDKEAITNPWRGGWREGSPGADGQPLGTSSPVAPAGAPNVDPDNEHLKPSRDSWRGADGKGGLGLSLKTVMETMIGLFSAQMFLWGVVHCDPHPGNIFIRRKPGGGPELVLIDHGLYVRLDPKFRQQYALFWKSLMAFDNKTISEIVRSWGISNPDIFASATLMRPYTGGDQSTLKNIRGSGDHKSEQERAYEMQVKMRQGIKEILGDGSKLPQELIFIGRNFRIVQGNNQFLGSPVNRIKITGIWASRALVDDPNVPWRERMANYLRHITFRILLLSTDLVFWYSKLKQWAGVGKGMDDDIEKVMKGYAKEMGIELNHNVFEG
jgi:aarF domain-containing kinase